MAVTIAELLADAQNRLTGPAAEPRQVAQEAVAAFTHIARALDGLYSQRPYEHKPEQQHPAIVADLAYSARAASTCWPGASGQVGDLVGVAADAIATRARTFTDPQRWALSLAFAETARRCVDTARNFPPYRNIPHLGAVREAAVVCEQRAAAAPVNAGDRTALDRLIADPVSSGSGLSSAIDAAAALHAALLARPSARLTMAELLITVNAAQVATAHAAAYARQLPPDAGQPPWHGPALAAPDAWRAARLHCRPFDDATKLRPPADSPIIDAAARLGRTLIDHLGPAPTPGAASPPHAGAHPAAAATLLTVTSLLPEIADRLQWAAADWGHTRQLWAPQRQLLAYEDRKIAAADPARVAIASHHDTEPLVISLHVAGTLTTALASDLATSIGTRLPNVVRAHTTTVAASTTLSPMAASAHDALRRAQLLPVAEWAVPTRPGPARTQPR